MVDKCSNCFYGRSPLGFLSCVKHAPQSIGTSSLVDVQAQWLRVEPDWWCGDYVSGDPDIYAGHTTGPEGPQGIQGIQGEPGAVGPLDPAWSDAWVEYAPALAAGAGAFASVSALGKYKQVGAAVFFLVELVFTDIGTVTDYFTFTLPSPPIGGAVSVNLGFFGAGSGGGKSWMGRAGVGSDLVTCLDVDNAFSLANGHSIFFSGMYETA